MTRARRIRLSAVPLSLALLAACSSSDATPTSEPAVTEPAVTEPAVTEPAVTEPAVAEATTVADADVGRIAASESIFAGIADDEPGCTVAVSRDGTVVWATAVGASSLDPLEPMTTDTVVDIGSTSKQFTATAIAILVQRGDVALDEPVSTYVPDLPSWTDEVTIDQLLHHTSGITDYIGLLLDDGIDFADPSDDADALRVLAATTELEFEPGDHFEYSNSNYFLLGQVVLDVTGDDLGTFLASEVFDPLGLSMVMDPTAEIHERATSYELGDGGSFVVADSPWTQLGDGGVQTTPTQLVTWASEYWAPTIGDDPDGLAEMRFDDAVVVGDGDATSVYGFGMGRVEFDGRDVLTHSGGWGGFVTTFVVDPVAHVAVSGTCTAAESVPDSPFGDPGVDLVQIWTA